MHITSETITETCHLKATAQNPTAKTSTRFTAIATRDAADGWMWRIDSHTVRYGLGGEVLGETWHDDIPEPWFGAPTRNALTAELRAALSR